MRLPEFQSEPWLPLPPEALFRFFADAVNPDSMPFDFIGHRWLARPDVEMVFRHRSNALKERFIDILGKDS